VACAANIWRRQNHRQSILIIDSNDLDSNVLSPDPDSVDRMRQLGLRPEDFEVTISRASGPGGQNVNKVSTAVTLRHRPSGLSVTSQDTRSQYQNRQLAFRRLIALIEKKRTEWIGERRAAIERDRRRNSRRPPALKREIRRTKERRSAIKATRGKVSAE
jgi:protein subunit release factor B